MFFKICLFVCFFSVISAAFSQTQPRLVLPVGHTDNITCIKYSADKKYFLTTSEDKSVRVWDAKLKNELITLYGHTQKVNNGEFSPDGKYVLTSSDDGTIRIWNIENGEELKKISNKISKIINAHFSPNGEFIIVTTGDNSIRIYNYENIKEVYKLELDCKIIDADFSFDGNFILVNQKKNVNEFVNEPANKNEPGVYITSADGKTYKSIYVNFCRIFDFKSKRELILDNSVRFELITNEIRQTNKYILSCRNDSVYCLYDFQSNNQHFIFTKNKKIKKVNLNEDNKYLIILYADNSISVYDASSLLKYREFNVSPNFSCSEYYRKGVIISFNNKIVLSGWSDIFIYNTEGEKLNEFALSRKGIANDRNYTLLGGQNELIVEKGTWEEHNLFPVFYSLKDGKVSKDLEGSVDFIATENNLNNNTFKNNWSIWDYKTGQSVTKFKDPNWKSDENESIILDSIFEKVYNTTNRGVHSNCHTDFSNDSSLILTFKDARLDTTMDLKRIRIWNKKGEILKILDCKQIKSAQFNSTGQKIVSVSYDNFLYLWDIKSSRADKIISDFSETPLFADFAYNDSIIVISTDKSIYIYNVIKDLIIQKLNGVRFWNNSGFSFNYDKTKLIINTKQQCFIYDLNANKTVISLNSFDSWISSASFATDDNYIVTTDLSKKTIVWNANTGKKMYTRLQLIKGDWLVYDEHYRFDGTPGAIEKLYFVCGLEVLELNQVKDSLYVPNLVQRIMNGENLNHLPKLSELQICGVTPLVEPLDEKNYKYRITPRTGGIGDIDIYINRVVRQTINTKKLKKEDNAYVLNIDPSLIKNYSTPGEENQIKVIAKTANNSISSRGITLQVESTENKKLKQPSVHAVMIGIDDYKGDELDLNYAAKDANDFQIALQLATKKYFNTDDTNRVNFYNLTIDRNAKIGTDKIKGITPDRGAIFNTLHQIEKNSKPEDLFILFFAGHGEIVDTDQLLLLTTEAGKSNFQGIRMRELLEQVNKIPAGKRILILDACHSGAAINNLDMAQYTGKRDVKDAALKSQRLKELDKLASKSGFVIITASSSDQKALELPQYEHGLLTYALLNAMLNNKNALNENNQLQLNKWLDATEEEMKKLSKDQSAESMVPISFIMGKIDDEVRNSIQLKELPTVFIENVMNLNIGFDNLGIKKLLADGFAENSRGAENKLFIADTPGAIHINIIYETTGLEITAKIVLMKNQNLIDKITLNGNNKQLSDFINQLMQKVKSAIQK